MRQPMRAHLAGDELHVDGVGRLGAELGQQRGGEQQQAADWAEMLSRYNQYLLVLQNKDI